MNQRSKSRGRGRGSDGGLFETAAKQSLAYSEATPLPERMRPESLGEVLGQRHLLDPDRPLRVAIEGDQVLSMVLWGPPGTGKTTLARLVAKHTQAVFVPFSAVLGTTAQLREILAEARERRAYHGKRTVLFIDELHRFNKAQQDGFLPHVEDGSITLIGATTENPSFSVNGALLSRCRVFRLEQLSHDDLLVLMKRAMADDRRGLGSAGVVVPDQVLNRIALHAQGDARRALGALELVVRHHRGSRVDGEVTIEEAARVVGDDSLLYDKTGEEHYNVVSALIKSMRGTDPDAAIYWAMRMLEAGEDPLFLLRRLVIFASEDIGNADPRALQVAISADEAFRRLGMPEGIYPIAQAVLYLAVAPKSNAVKKAWQSAREQVRRLGTLPVPLHLRNASTKLNEQMGYGQGYRYPHDEPGNFAAGQKYLPDDLQSAEFYEPTDQGLEKQIRDKLERLRGRR